MAEHRWMAQAACLGNVSAIWDDSTPTAEALRICYRCPVQRTCAEYGLARPSASDAGVLGGLGLYDRDHIRDGEQTLEEAWDRRLRWLANRDYQEALAEDYARTMPRLEFA